MKPHTILLIILPLAITFMALLLFRNKHHKAIASSSDRQGSNPHTYSWLKGKIQSYKRSVLSYHVERWRTINVVSQRKFQELQSDLGVCLVKPHLALLTEWEREQMGDTNNLFNEVVLYANSNGATTNDYMECVDILEDRIEKECINEANALCENWKAKNS